MCYEKFCQIHKKACVGISFFDKVTLCRSAASLKTKVFSCEFCKIRKITFFAEHHQTTASNYSSINSTSSEGKFASETVNFDTKTMYQSEPQVKLIKKDTPGLTTGFRSSRSYTSVFKNFENSTGKNLCLSLLACNSIKYRYFPVKFTKFIRTSFFIEQLQWLLLRFN